MARIVLGVAGGIAAYKACELLRRLKEAGHDVTVVPTPHALEFVGATTWAALSGKPVHTQVFEAVENVPHVALGRQAELVVVAPATADLLARAATGRADDLLTTVLLTATCPVLMCPAMHTEMWHHAATQANVATLRSRGVIVMDPAEGRLTGADSGPGRLPEAADIAAVALSLVASPEAADAARARDLSGVRLVVSAGGTRAPLDPVRFLGNASSGLMGCEIARAASLRGADVTLVAANLAFPAPSGVTVFPVVTTEDLAREMTRLAPRHDVVVMAAAVADFAPREVADSKIKKSADEGLHLDLVQTTDVLATLCRHRREDQTIIGFAAETAGSPERLAELGQIKLARKGCDLLVANDVSGGGVFGQADNAVFIIGPDGVLAQVAGSKAVVAHALLDRCARSVGRRS